MAVQISLQLLSETFISLGSRKNGVFSPKVGIWQADEVGGHKGEKRKSGCYFSSSRFFL